MKIQIIDPVDTQIMEVVPEELKWIKDLLSHKATFFIRKQYKSKRKEYRKSLVVGTKKSGYFFPTGFVPKVIKSAKTSNIDLKVEGQSTLEHLVPISKIQVPGKELREDQTRLVTSAIEHQRGVLVSPTGSGKTVLLMALLSAFPGCKILVVTHSKDIVSQTIDELRKHKFKSVGTVLINILITKIVVTTRQSLVEKTKEVEGEPKKKKVLPKVKPQHKAWMRDLKIVIIDECHLAGGFTGQYNAILRSTLASMRIGLTATAPEEEQIAMTLEGMLGPTIDEVTFEEGEELGIIATVKLELLSIPYRSSIADLKVYKDFVRAGLVENRARNRLIIQKAKDLVEEGMSVLIFINNVEPPLAHGDHLMDMADILELEVVFLKGKTETEIRNQVKKEVIDGSIQCVITSKIWKEGVNIPNLGAVILAGGGKAKLSTLQSMGRGLRRVEGKEIAVLVDCLDPYKYLAEHSIQRLQTYHEMGWL